MKRWDVALTVVLVACALVTTGLVVRREFFGPAATQRPAAAELQFIDDWRSLLGTAVTQGSLEDPVQLIEFADFECPFCAKFHQTVKSVQEGYPGKIAVSFVHFPLPGHRFALPAARVAECAGEQGRFEAMADLLFEHQREFGLKPWPEFASEAGVANASAFETCIQNDAPLPRVEAGIRAGERFDVQATPTVIINGWKLANPPSATQLQEMVEAILDGENPIS